MYFWAWESYLLWFSLTNTVTQALYDLSGLDRTTRLHFAHVHLHSRDVCNVGPSVMKAVNDIATGEMKAVAITQPGVTPAFRPTKDAAECTAVVEKDIAGKLEEPAGKAADTAVTVVGGATNQVRCTLTPCCVHLLDC